MHPGMAGLEKAWNDGALAPIVCAGAPHPTRSHFDGQDFMERAAPGDLNVEDGWLNRPLAALDILLARKSTMKAVNTVAI